MKLFLLSLIISFWIISGVVSISNAQCSLCKANAESSLKEGNTQAKGLNLGIMYLLVMPYALVGGIGYWWYVQKKKEAKEKETEI